MKTHRVRSILGPLEVGHAVNAGKGCMMTVATMSIELLLGEDIPTRLFDDASQPLLRGQIDRRRQIPRKKTTPLHRQ